MGFSLPRDQGNRDPHSRYTPPGEGRRNAHSMSDACCLPAPIVASLKVPKHSMTEILSVPFPWKTADKMELESNQQALCNNLPYSNTYVCRKHTFTCMYVVRLSNATFLGVTPFKHIYHYWVWKWFHFGAVTTPQIPCFPLLSHIPPYKVFPLLNWKFIKEQWGEKWPFLSLTKCLQVYLITVAPGKNKLNVFELK